jgi:hypothetical protein
MPASPANFALALIVALLAAIGTAAAASAADFGGPPSGEIPILYNNHTVYATPDVLRQRRVLAALVRDGEIYVPLRSMFEQMGATVSVSNGGRTITADKPGASVSVTLGTSDVIVNGETRPLDVPPMLYHGVVLVPVRVLSEALGAYVQWVPSRRVVVVRYLSLPPPPPPTAAPTVAPVIVAPTAAPIVIATAAPSAIPTPVPFDGFIQAAYSAPRNDNEFVAGTYCDTILISAAYVFPNSRFAVKFDYRQDTYVTSDNLTDTIGNHFTRFSTIDGGTAFTPVFLAKQTTFDGRLEYRIAAPQVYVGLAYLHTANNYGYPQLDALGVGIEKLPDLRRGITFFGSFYYYPTASGNYTVPFAASVNSGKTYQQQYQVLQYDLGLAAVIPHTPLYVYGGFGGNRYTAQKNAPVGQIHDGPYLGLGVKI